MNTPGSDISSNANRWLWRGVAPTFALLAFGQLLGFAGVLLALPASAALLVWLRRVRYQYPASGIYQGNNPIS